MRKRLQIASIIVLLVGVLIGPAYLIWCVMWSGKSVGKFLVFEQDITAVEISAGGGTTGYKQTGQAAWHTPITVALSPDMNPIRITAHASYPEPTTRRSSEYELTLSRGDQVVWQEPFSVSSSRDRDRDAGTISVGTSHTRSSESLGVLSIAEPGAHTIDVKAGTSDLDIAKLEIAVRCNVQQADKRLYIPGIVLAVVAVLGLLVTAPKKRTEASPPAESSSAPHGH